MSIGFFIIGGLIFAVYVYLMFWNIVYSNKKQREENYPNLGSEGCDPPLGPVKKVVRRSVKTRKTVYLGTKAKETSL